MRRSIGGSELVHWKNISVSGYVVVISATPSNVKNSSIDLVVGKVEFSEKSKNWLAEQLTAMLSNEPKGVSSQAKV